MPSGGRRRAGDVYCAREDTLYSIQCILYTVYCAREHTNIQFINKLQPLTHMGESEHQLSSHHNKSANYNTFTNRPSPTQHNCNCRYKQQSE
jgi:hypothetical protein